MGGNVTQEIELTFLAAKLPDEIKNQVPDKMFDMYVPAEDDFAILRLRKRGEKYEITKKQPLAPGDYVAHSETTIPLTQAEFEALLKSEGRIVEKLRYKVEISDHEAEVDIFTGQLEGLVVIDFEFNSLDEAKKFKAPDCCLADVTQEKFILGGQLAGQNYNDIAEDLRRYGYKKL